MRACRRIPTRGWGPRTARKWSLLYPVVVVASTACNLAAPSRLAPVPAASIAWRRTRLRAPVPGEATYGSAAVR